MQVQVRGSEDRSEERSDEIEGIFETIFTSLFNPKTLASLAHRRVDVILDPHCDGGCWYPLKEKTRKMAPQFKSNGVGYIRLGDDMSKNGVAFLSGDKCVNFFSSKNVSPTAAEGGEREGGRGEKRGWQRPRGGWRRRRR